MMKPNRKIIASVAALFFLGIGFSVFRGGWMDRMAVSLGSGLTGFYVVYFFEPRSLKIFVSRRSLSRFAVLFFLLLLLPIFGNILGMGGQPVLPEKRMEKTVERSTVWSSVSGFFKGFRERFIFRDRLIPGYNSLKYIFLGVSPVPKVIIGHEGWLFQARINREPNTPGYYRSVQPFSESDLAEWRQRLEERHNWLKDRGIYYLVILAPDKASIYPEYLPGNLVPFYKESRLDQLLNYMRKYSAVPLLDLRSVLLEGKLKQKIYYKTDSHWNEPGAFLAYREIVRHLGEALGKGEQLKIKTNSDFSIKKCRLKNGNLSMMLAVKDRGLTETRLSLRPRFHRSARKAPLPDMLIPRSLKPQAFSSTDPDLPNAVMLHDSFGRNLKPFLSEHFSRILFLRDWGFRFHKTVIQMESPKIVLDEIAEHYLYRVHLSN